MAERVGRNFGRRTYHELRRSARILAATRVIPAARRRWRRCISFEDNNFDQNPNLRKQCPVMILYDVDAPEDYEYYCATHKHCKMLDSEYVEECDNSEPCEPLDPNDQSRWSHSIRRSIRRLGKSDRCVSKRKNFKVKCVNPTEYTPGHDRAISNQHRFR